MRFAHILSVVLLLGASTLSAQIGTRNGALPPESASGRTQTEALPIQTDTYGTYSMTWKTFSAWDFHPMGSGATYEWTTTTGTLSLYQTANGSSGLMAAPLGLPEGALLSTLEFSVCDTTNTGQIYFFLDQIPKAGGGYSETNYGSTGAAATPGCALFTFSFTPIQIDNANKSYFLMVQFFGTGTTLILNSARAGYKLQVSPSPAIATFTDVPLTHPYNKFVEALYAAGITAGCGGGNFCPDRTITRGEVAVYLAAALGLHFVP